MRGNHAADKNDRHSERTSGTVPGQIEDEGHGADRRQFGQRQDICELTERRKLKALAGDDANRTENDQAAGRAEKSADHRVRHL